MAYFRLLVRFVTTARRFRRILFIIFDSFLIGVSVILAFLLRFDGLIPAEKWGNILFFTGISLATAIPIFWLQGLYKMSWSYVSFTDIPKILRGVALNIALSGLFLFLLKTSSLLEEFPRSVIFAYGVLLFIFIGALRFAKRIYWQFFQGKLSIPTQKTDFPFPFQKIVQHEKERTKTVLLTGGAGYLGSMVSRLLLLQGYRVKVVDQLFFGDASTKDLMGDPNFELIKANIFDLRENNALFADVDAVIHLAAVVGEPACLANKDISLRTNYFGTVYMARLCKAFGVKKFIFASTCSVYGEAEKNGIVCEESSLNPVDFYGETKIYAERELMRLMDENFSCTVLRFGTLYGVSYRMRFDLVVNTFAKKAIVDKEIFLFGGQQWRPLVHVHDAARAIYFCLEAPASKVSNQVFNVGGDRENYLISDLGEIIREYFPETSIKTLADVADQRSYKVSFEKIKRTLGFEPEKTVRDGVAEIKEAIAGGFIGDLNNKYYYNHLFQK
ncbi:MAG: NAD-dependent epimerase/dehydratase family protein [Candidatus Wildermuthbacteria bacterium]|nr:NAD-dependent epimerase/dehydratase family protein [Candidatus Wildermuthbacteria bacterium]